MAAKSFFMMPAPSRPVIRFIISGSLVLSAYLASGVIFGIAFRLFGFLPDLYVSLFLIDLLLAGALIGIYKFLCLALDDKPLAYVGLAFHGHWKTELGRGFALGAVMIFAVAALGAGFGAEDFSWMLSAAASPGHILRWAAYSLVIFLVAGTAEELTFRGYPFQRLADSIGPSGAVAVFSGMFGVAHLWNSSHSWLSTLNTILVGVTLSVAYLRTRALWLPIGLHVSWNVFEGYVFGYPVSGILLPAALVRPEPHGAVWLTGGAYGPEASVLTTGVIVLGTVYLLLSKRIYVSKEMRELVFAPVAEPVNLPGFPPPKSGGTGGISRN